ncbi:MAG: M15 family metallopeptidase [Lachnospiraceae bacterium]|nr:M15 family metallopeptidase [Lachnospiraceae bacterium]
MTCSFLAHYLTGSETLEEYARNNPDAAYGTNTEAQKVPPDDVMTDPNPESDSITESIQDRQSDPGSVPKPAQDIPPNFPETSTETSTASSAYNNPKETAPDAENDNMTVNENRTTYQPGFYYEPLNDDVKQRITGISYPEEGCSVPYEDLNYVGLLYIDFNGKEQIGELICNQAIAQDIVEIFYELYRNEYQIERIRLIDEYDGDDTLSMLDNNTSCFNYRVVDGTDNLSKHALGCAIDINPFYNPYVVFNRGANGETYISPKGSEIYADRSQDFPYKIDETDLCYKLFTEHGFTWGGNWNSCKDYQHFQIVLK